MDEISQKRKVLNKKAVIIRLIFILFYVVILFFIYLFLVNINIQHWIIVIILFFLILIVVGPLITGISKSMYHQMIPKKEKGRKSDYQLYKEQLQSKSQAHELKAKDVKAVNLDFKYKKSIIRKCTSCGITIPNFVRVCPYCVNTILD